MKKFFFFSLLACVALFFGCGEKPRNTFTVGFDADFPPYGFKDLKSGDYVGFDLDLALEVCKRNDWTLVKKPIVWDAKDAELNSGNIDCIWNGFTLNKEREDKYTWTTPYVMNQQLIMVRKDSGIVKLAELNGKKVVSQDGSSGAGAIKEFLENSQKEDSKFNFDLKLVPEYNTAAQMLRTKAVDAVALDSAVAATLVEQSKGEFVLLEEKLCDEVYAVGFKLGNTKLRDTVENTLKEMVKDGTAEVIVKRWATEHKDDKGATINFILKAE